MDRGTRGHAILWSQFLELGKNRFFKKKIGVRTTARAHWIGKGSKGEYSEAADTADGRAVYQCLCSWWTLYLAQFFH